MSTPAPLFTIITVTWNASHTLPRTMQSVAEQTCTNYEHIVMDGLSTDGTAEIANDMATERTRVFSRKDAGLYDAMNNAMGEARGDYLIFLNAGDKFHDADTLQTIANAVRANDMPGIVYGQTDIVDDRGNYIGPRHLTAPEVLTYKSFADGMLVCHQAFVALRRIAPLYDTRRRFSADYEWCLRCLQHSRKNVYTGTVLIDYLSEGLTTKNHRKSLIERFQIMCKYYGTIPTVLRHIKFAVRNFSKTHNVKRTT